MIQKHIVKRGKRSIVHQIFHPKKDEKLVAAWKLDLDKIRHAFDVRFLTCVWQLLTFLF